MALTIYWYWTSRREGAFVLSFFSGQGRSVGKSLDAQRYYRVSVTLRMWTSIGTLLTRSAICAQDTKISRVLLQHLPRLYKVLSI